VSNHFTGHQAEQYAAKYLEGQGYHILELNWRTKTCEIDIVAKKGNTVYLVEVKYRASDSYGTGFDYITSKKLQQMRFAAEYWASSNNWQGDYQLAAIQLSGGDFEVRDFINSV
jgi:uncharacterized protein (TIGR00252 family)